MPLEAITSESVVTIAVLVAIGVGTYFRIVVEFEQLHALSSSDDSTSTPPKTNCPSCGSRTTDDGTCDYCGESLAEDPADHDSSDRTQTESGWSDETGWS
ncbi:hypothetical protein [Natronobacterium texcoconense]|uniref:Uncharacterized protein n=1 Tax=Natronobacterium texcoconense TaxID=1095778 RepID=A0A1H1ARD6_NATTX|nr:hypothetical protein [Natronobacterium texcoconense]SDQ42174.1 hypothetical protein SAMN04489842_0784 [Natronobacterium texcoconense]